MTKKRQKQPLNAFLAAIATLPILISCASNGDSISPTSSPSPTSPKISAPESPTNLPQQPFSVPGWLAFGTKPQKEGIADYAFSPANPDAEIAIFSDQWSEVPSETTLIALTPTGLKQEVKFRRNAEEPYGCDDLPTPMATFTTSQAMPEGGFWLLPAVAADSAKAVALQELPLDGIPSNLLPPEKRQPNQARAWQAGSTIVLLTKETPKKAKLTIANDSEEIFNSEVAILAIEGAYEEDIDLSLNYQPGIPIPIGVFQLDSSSQLAIALWYPSFEGHHFQVVASTQGKIELLKAGYLYYCAF